MQMRQILRAIIRLFAHRSVRPFIRIPKPLTLNGLHNANLHKLIQI
jgi:hypothetical protein